MHRAGRPLIPGGFRRPARWRGATCSGAQRGAVMSVDSFDAGKRPADLVARLSKLDAAMGISPALSAKLAEFEALHATYTEQAAWLDELQSQVVETSAAWQRESQRDAQHHLRAWRRDLDRREQLDAALIELAAARRQRASGGGALPPAPGVALRGSADTAAPAPAPLSAELPAAERWPDERIAQRLAEIKRQVPKDLAPVRTLLQEMAEPYNDATRQKVRRAVNAHEATKALSAAPGAVWPGYTKPLKRTA